MLMNIDSDLDGSQAPVEAQSSEGSMLIAVLDDTADDAPAAPAAAPTVFATVFDPVTGTITSIDPEVEEEDPTPAVLDLDTAGFDVVTDTLTLIEDDIEVQRVSYSRSTPPAPKEPIERADQIARKSDRQTHIAIERLDWGPEQVRDYVIEQIEQRFGPTPRDPRKEKSVFSSFCQRYEGDASRIAIAAFDICDGWWNNAPISINRFCKGSDPYFGDVIRDRLPEEGGITDW